MIDTQLLSAAHDAVQKDVDAVDAAMANLQEALARFKTSGLEQARKVGVPIAMIGRVFHYLGLTEGSAGAAVAAWGGVHYELHSLIKQNLAPNDDSQKLGGGGGKGDPQPPVK